MTAKVFKPNILNWSAAVLTLGITRDGAVPSQVSFNSVIR